MKLESSVVSVARLTIESQQSSEDLDKGTSSTGEERQMRGFIDAIVARLSVKEKIAQLQGIWIDRRSLESGRGEFLPEHAAKSLSHGIGHIARPEENIDPLTPNKTPAQTIQFINDVQSWLLENSSSKIPAMFHAETLHGHMAEDATVFPQSIGLASTWNPSLVGEVFEAVARETRARGIAHALSPVLDVAKDPRWGRIEETYGEDPYLVSALGMSVVAAMQGEGLMIDETKVLVTLKHLAGHGYPMSGQNTAPAMMGERYLREQLLTPFEQVIRSFDVASVMASYNEIDGLPSHANPWLLKQVLRDEWGFKGTVISDYFAIEELATRHFLVEDRKQAALLAFNSGVDLELPNPKDFDVLESALAAGEVSMEQLDAAVFRVLRDKCRADLFNSALCDGSKISEIGSAQHKALSVKAAEESIILLKNSGILPLDLAGVKKLALLGPHVDEAVLGGYSDIPSSTTTLADALQASLPSHVELIVEPGMQLTADQAPVNEKALRAKCYSKSRWNVDNIDLVDDQTNAPALARARQAAADADLVILVVGDNEGTSREGWQKYHLGDRSDLSFAGSQPKLIEAVIAAGKPIVAVLLNGRPPELSPWLANFAAVLEAWYPGEQGGEAVAGVLLGRVNPSAKLPLSFPRSSGQIPGYYNVKPSANRGYAHEQNGPLFAFGFGLSYTTFEYTNLRLERDAVGLEEDISLSFDIENCGDRFGKEIAQLYIHDSVASVTRPIKELKGFRKVSLDAGEKKRIEVKLAAKALYFWGVNMKRIVEAGRIEIMIGASSDDIRLRANVAITGTAEFENKEQLPFFSRWCESTGVDSVDEV